MFRNREAELRTENLDFTFLYSSWETMKLYTYFLWFVVVVRQGLTWGSMASTFQMQGVKVCIIMPSYFCNQSVSLPPPLLFCFSLSLYVSRQGFSV